MDSNNTAMGGAQFTGLPVGFGVAFAMSESATSGDRELTETEREHIIMRCKDAKTEEEQQKIVDSLVPDGNLNTLYEHRDTAEG